MDWFLYDKDLCQVRVKSYFLCNSIPVYEWQEDSFCVFKVPLPDPAKKRQLA